MRELANKGDSPQFDQSYHYVVRLGTLAKVYQHLGKSDDFAMTQSMYTAGVRAMVMSDMGESDLIPRLKRHNPVDKMNNYVVRTTSDITP